MPAGPAEGRSVNGREGRGEMRERVVEAVLPNIAFDGWSMTALRAGAAAAGYAEADAAVLFPRGPIEAVEVHLALSDRRMAEGFATLDLASAGRTDRVRAAIRLRLEQNAPHREAVRHALALLALPPHAPLALRSLYGTVDLIWHLAGDRATDFSFYTKRALLAGVYGATVPVWLDDRTGDLSVTFDFLDRRLRDVGRLPKAIGRLGRFCPRPPGVRRFSRRFGR